MINKANIDDWLIRSIEKDLNNAEQRTLDGFLKTHPEFNSDLEAYTKTIIQPDEQIIFLNKEILKKKTGGRIIPIGLNQVFIIAVAACLATLLGFAWWINMEPTSTTNSPVAINNYAPIKSPDVLNSNQPEIISDNNYSEKNILPSTSIIKQKKNQPSSVALNHIEKIIFAVPVTFSNDTSLHIISTNQIAGINYMTANKKIKKQTGSPQLIIDDNGNYKVSKFNTVVTDMLDLSGKSDWAKTYEKYNKLKNKQYELSFNSPLLSFHKTFGKNLSN